MRSGVVPGMREVSGGEELGMMRGLELYGFLGSQRMEGRFDRCWEMGRVLVVESLIGRVKYSELVAFYSIVFG